MNFIRNLKAEPWRFDYFVLLRHLERTFKDQPRIGDSATVREEIARFGQNPFMEFPASNVSGADQDEEKPLKIFVRHLGMLGPQGPLPLSTTEEAYHYALAEDEAFPRFLDLFNHRFIQLFFRAWADSRPIAQHDRPDADRFVAYIGSAVGIGSGPYHHLDSLPDGAKLSFAGLLGAQAKSASRLAAAIQGIFNVKAEVEEFVGSRLAVEAAEWTLLGRGYNVLGEDALLGRSIFSVQDKNQDSDFFGKSGSVYPLPADRESLRAAGRPGVLLQWRTARLRRRVGDTRGGRRACPARSIWSVGLDQLDGAKLDQQRGLSSGRALSSRRTHENQARTGAK